MLQRIQSVWLLLASVCSAVSFRFPFYTGDWNKDNVAAVVELDADTTTPLLLVTVAAGALALVTIFLFSNRKVQLRLCWLGLLLSAGLLALYVVEIQSFMRGSIALWCLFTVAILICYALALRGIMRDEKLIRSMDRFR